MRRILLTIAYDGSAYSGWQKQPGKQTVQGEIEKAIEKVVSEPCEIFASGRTDAGVHALGQTAHFDLVLPIPVSKIANILNNLLPNDIAILKAQVVPNDFHARFSIQKKCYMYRVYNCEEKDVFLANATAWVSYPLQIDAMRQAAKLLCGTHDFHGFCAAAAVTNDYHRTIYDIRIQKKKSEVIFEVEGSGFLYNMVRILVGTMVDVGRGKLSLESVQKALDTGERSYAGITMPASGLYLKKTYYDGIMP